MVGLSGPPQLSHTLVKEVYLPAASLLARVYPSSPQLHAAVGEAARLLNPAASAVFIVLRYPEIAAGVFSGLIPNRVLDVLPACLDLQTQNEPNEVDGKAISVVVGAKLTNRLKLRLIVSILDLYSTQAPLFMMAPNEVGGNVCRQDRVLHHVGELQQRVNS